MACKDARLRQAKALETKVEETQPNVEEVKEVTESRPPKRLLFGVDSKVRADDLLQNNITEFEWVVRNKIYPVYWGRNIAGENCLTKEEIEFLHSKACKIAPIYCDKGEKLTENQGEILAEKIVNSALELEIPKGTAIFLEILENEEIDRDFMFGFAETLIHKGYTPAFKANTDALFDFDREFSRGMQTNRDVFEKCLIWAVAPSLEEYERVTTTHLIHPDNWVPFAPSGITRQDIAVWQYGKECHPINDNNDKETFFNVNLVRNDKVIIEKMF